MTTAIRHSTGETRQFSTEMEAERFCLRRGDEGQLWRIERNWQPASKSTGN